MKRKLLLAGLTLLCALACAFGFAACGGNTGEGNNGGVLPEHKHKWSNVWQSDDTHHWHNCTADGCNITENPQKNGYAPHDFTNGNCVCGKEKHAHSMQFTPRKEADCTNKGNIDYWFCEDCDKYFLDEDGKNEISLRDTMFGPYNHNIQLHNGQAATCTESGWNDYETCSRCDYTTYREIPALATEHNFSDEFTVDVIATCTDKGVQSKHCLRCPAKTDEEEIPALGHNFSAYSNDQSRHWRSCTRWKCDFTQTENHTEGNDCSVCHFVKNGTAGLAYELNGEKTAYTVTGIGQATDSNIIIPSLHEGLPVTGIAVEAFLNCESITSVTIPDSISTIGRSAFACPNLTTVYFNAVNCEISEYTNGYYTRDNEYSPGFDLNISVHIGATVTSVPDYFRQAFAVTGEYGGIFKSRIAEIVFDENSSCTYIGDYAFNHCDLLTSIYIPKSVNFMRSNTFWASLGKCESIIVEDGNRAYYSENNCLIEKTGTLLYGCKNSVIPDDGNVKELANSAFAYCYELTSISLPDSVTKICENSFWHCKKLESLTIGSGVINIGNELTTNFSSKVFIDCVSLKNITVSENNTEFSSKDGVLYDKAKTQILYVPKGIDGEITIPDGVTGMNPNIFSDIYTLTINCEATEKPDSWSDGWNGSCPVIWNCKNNDKDENGYSYAIIDGIRYSFKDNEATVMRIIKISESVTIPASVAHNNVNYIITSIHKDAFKDCGNYKHLNYTGDIAGWCEIDGLNYLDNSKVFIGNQKLQEITSLTLPQGVKRIGASAFKGCALLTEVTIADTVTAIGSDAFYGCPVERAAIPALACKFISNPALKAIAVTSGESIVYEAFYNCRNLTDVTISDSVKDIADRAFFGCPVEMATIPALACKTISNTELKSVIITSGESIEEHSFNGCAKLSYVELPETLIIINNSAFYRCVNLKEITIPDSVTSICNYAFSGCNNLTDITLGSGIKLIENYALNSCTRLESIYFTGDIASWCGINGLSSLQNFEIYIGGQKLKEMTDITIPDNITSIASYTFGGCYLLTEITIPEKITGIGFYAFNDCNTLTIYCEAAEKPDGWSDGWNDSCPVVWNCKNNDKDENGCAYTIIDGIRYSLKDNQATVDYQPNNITKAIIPETVSYKNQTYTVTSIRSHAFSDCHSVTEIFIPRSVTSIGSGALTRLNSLEKITVAVDNANYRSNGNCLIETASRTLIAGCKNSVIPDDGSVTSIGEWVFAYCEYPTTLIIPGTVTKISKGAFTHCFGLTVVTLGYGVKTIAESAFSECVNLTKINIPESVTTIERGAFYTSCCPLTIYCEAKRMPSGWNSSWYFNCPVVWDCKNNDKDKNGHIYTIIDGIRYSLKDNIANVDYQPKNITVANIPSTVTYEGITYSVTDIGFNAFTDCTLLKSVTICNGIKNIYGYAFSGCTSLVNISIPDSITNIPDSIFSGCINLQYNHYGDGLYLGNDVNKYVAFVTTVDEDISSFEICADTKVIFGGAFSSCSNLTGITIPDSVTSIGNNTFRYCNSLTEITIPSTVTAIGREAFYNCDSLTAINYGGTKEQWNAIDKDHMWDNDTGDYVIHCTDGDLQKSTEDKF